MIDRLESSSGSNGKTTKKLSSNKSFQDEQLNDSTNLTSIPNVKRIARRENHDYSVTSGQNGGFIFRHKSPHEEIYVQESNPSITRFEIDREEIAHGGRRTANGTNVSYFTVLRS